MYSVLTENCPLLHSCVLVCMRNPWPVNRQVLFLPILLLVIDIDLAVMALHHRLANSIMLSIAISSCHIANSWQQNQVQPPAPAQTTCQLLGPGGPPVISSLTMFLILYCRNHFTCAERSSCMSVLDKQPRCHCVVTCQVQIQLYNAMQWWWVTNQITYFEHVSNT